MSTVAMSKLGPSPVTEYLRRVLNDAGYSAPGLSGSGDGETGYVTLVHPVEGPVNLYRTARVATDKQRMMAAAENPRCAWPGCNQPADLSQIHHLTAWSRGGETNMKNLVVCCAYHNGINDDDPNKPTGRGYVFRMKDGIGYIPPWGAPITATPEYQQALARLTAEQPPGAS